MHCPSCGYQNADAANFCARCGHALRSREAADARSTDEAAAGPDAAGGPSSGDATTVVPSTPAAPTPATPSPSEDATSVIETVDDDESTDADDPGATAVVQPVGDDDLRTCPNCDAPNAAARTICGRCGADLETGHVAKLPAVAYAPPGERDRDEDTAPRSAQRAPREEGRGRRTALIAGAVVVVGGLLGVLAGLFVALRTGDGADEPDIPAAPVFDQARYPDDPDGLSVARIGASSTNTVGGEEKSVARLVDGDLATAWEHDGADNPGGVGEQVAVEFDQPVWIDTIVVGNGNQEDDGLFLGGSRAAQVRVRFDGEAVIDVKLVDQTGLQVVDLPSPVLTTGLQLQVQEVVSGDTYQELGLSELRFTGWVAEGDDARIAAERATVRG